MWRQAVTGDAGCPGSGPRATGLVPQIGYIEMVLLSCFLATEASLVN